MVKPNDPCMAAGCDNSRQVERWLAGLAEQCGFPPPDWWRRLWAAHDLVVRG